MVKLCLTCANITQVNMRGVSQNTEIPSQGPLHMCVCVCVYVLVTQLCLTLCDPWTVACQAPLSMEFSRQEYYFLLQRIFPTQGSNLGLLHCRQILY